MKHKGKRRFLARGEIVPRIKYPRHKKPTTTQGQLELEAERQAADMTALLKACGIDTTFYKELTTARRERGLK